MLIVTRTTQPVAFQSATQIGKTSDKKIADGAHIAYPRGTRLRKDLGFEGYAPKGTRTYIAKKSRKRELTRSEKGANRKLARVGVRVEHALAGVKRSRIIKNGLSNGVVDVTRLVSQTLHLGQFESGFRDFAAGKAKSNCSPAIRSASQLCLLVDSLSWLVSTLNRTLQGRRLE